MLLSSEAGSAPVDFVMVTMPTTLLLLPLLALFSLAQQEVALGVVSFDLARFAALADVSQSEIAAYRDVYDAGAQIVRESKGSSCFVKVTSSKKVNLVFWPETITISNSSRASCEID